MAKMLHCSLPGWMRMVNINNLPFNAKIIFNLVQCHLLLLLYDYDYWKNPSAYFNLIYPSKIHGIHWIRRGVRLVGSELWPFLQRTLPSVGGTRKLWGAEKVVKKCWKPLIRFTCPIYIFYILYILYILYIYMYFMNLTLSYLVLSYPNDIYISISIPLVALDHRGLAWDVCHPGSLAWLRPPWPPCVQNKNRACDLENTTKIVNGPLEGQVKKHPRGLGGLGAVKMLSLSKSPQFISVRGKYLEDHPTCRNW